MYESRNDMHILCWTRICVWARAAREHVRFECICVCFFLSRLRRSLALNFFFFNFSFTLQVAMHKNIYCITSTHFMNKFASTLTLCYSIVKFLSCSSLSYSFTSSIVFFSVLFGSALLGSFDETDDLCWKKKKTISVEAHKTLGAYWCCWVDFCSPILNWMYCAWYCCAVFSSIVCLFFRLWCLLPMSREYFAWIFY